MLKEIETHYTYDNNDVYDLLERKGYDSTERYINSFLVPTTIEIFLREYAFIDCENHVLKSDLNSDVENGAIEYTIFNILASYTERALHSLKESEVVSDIFEINNTMLCIRVHNLATDDITQYYLML